MKNYQYYAIMTQLTMMFAFLCTVRWISAILIGMTLYWGINLLLAWKK